MEDEELWETVVTSSAVLGNMRWKRDNESREIALPLLALGLRREAQGKRRFHCAPLSSRNFDGHADISKAFLRIAKPPSEWGSIQRREFRDFFPSTTERLQMTQPPGVRAHLNLQAWLKDAVKDWQQGMRNRTRDAKALYPSGFQIVSAGRELLATLADLVIADNTIFLLLCWYMRTAGMLTYTVKQAKKREDRDLGSLILNMTFRPCTLVELQKMATHNLLKAYKWTGIVYRRLQICTNGVQSVPDLLEEGWNMLANTEQSQPYHRCLEVEDNRLKFKPTYIITETVINKVASKPGKPNQKPAPVSVPEDFRRYEKWRRLEAEMCGFKLPYEPQNSSEDEEDEEDESSDTQQEVEGRAEGTPAEGTPTSPPASPRAGDKRKVRKTASLPPGQ